MSMCVSATDLMYKLQFNKLAELLIGLFVRDLSSTGGPVNGLLSKSHKPIMYAKNTV